MTGPSITVKVAFRTCQRRGPKAARHAVPSGPSAISRRIALAHHLDAAIDTGSLDSLSAAAAKLRLTRARITQISDLALLAPDIQEAVLSGRCEPRDRHLRAVGRHLLWTDQRRVFATLFPNVTLGDDHDERNEARSPERN